MRAMRTSRSETARTQADALAAWLRCLDPDRRPTCVITSPYLRAADTAHVAMADLGLDLEVDERLASATSASSTA